jgi:GTPase Era involved in 16S rRNA processing
MSSEKVKQNIEAIQLWLQDNVILSDERKEQYVQWCEDLTAKFEAACQTPLKIGLIGGTGVGKSTIINSLAGAEISVTHNERPYTNKVIVYHYLDSPQSQTANEHMISCKHDRQDISHIILFDFPDYDSHLFEHRQMVQEVSKQLDIIVWVASPEKYADQAMIHMMSELLQSSQNYCFVLNKTDQLQQDETAQIIGHWHILLRQNNIIEVPIFSFSALNHDNTFYDFQNWLFKKRGEHELKEITRANIDNQIQLKTKQIRQQIDCKKIAQMRNDLNKQMNQLNTFDSIRQKDILEIISPDALTAIHEYLSIQSRFIWPIGLSFNVMGRLKQVRMKNPVNQVSTGSGDIFLKTIDDAITHIQTHPGVSDSNISLLDTYKHFIDQYQDPRQISPLLGKIGLIQSTYFWLKQWVFMSIPVFFCIIYLSGIDQVPSVESIGIGSFLVGCFQIIIKLFQPEGLVAMISLLFIEIFISMQLASQWHKKLAKKSQDLYQILSRYLCKQLMITLHDRLQPLIDWAEQAQLDCDKMNAFD